MSVNYLITRILLIFPTLFFIILLNFTIIQFAPGGPVERTIALLSGSADLGQNQFSETSTIQNNANNNQANLQQNSNYAGSQGLDPQIIAEIEQLYGFDLPVTERFFKMIKDFLSFDFGESFFKGKPVIDLILERLPVSISLGLWSTLLIYLISIPLGIAKAVRNGSKFDFYTSLIIFIGYAIPSFIFAILLLVFLGKGGVLPIFPISGLTSDNFAELSFMAKIKDYALHLTLPTIALVVGGFAALTMLTKNSFLEEVNKEYVLTARAKGATEQRILFGHIFRNAMLLIVSQIPENLVKILFTGALLVEIIFSLEGLGLLGFEAALNRDYPVIFASLYIFSLIALVFNVVGDMMYAIIDPRITFASSRNG